jgi:threonylcarbamoyladenosine tRNA methylthiotransferase MtaB
MPTIAFHTLGCKSNQYETDMMKNVCRAAGFEIVPFEGRADIYIINTCTVTGNADKKSRNAVRTAKKKNRDSVVIVTGCYIESGNFNLKEADVLLRNKDKADILKCLPKIDLPSPLSHPTSTRIRANLMIEDGCENFCSYCIVPYVRGKVRSRPMEEILAEARRMAASGIREIVLTGINLGEYGRLPMLIDELSKIDGLLRIRLSSIEPMYITDDLIKAVKENPKVCKHLHIPMQSGDDSILKAMNRNYSSKDFLDMAKKIKKQVKDIAITTDIIVGFPGEDEAAFRNTCGLVDKVKFPRIHMFSYSDRQGTAASSFNDKVDPKTIATRYAKLGKLRDTYMLKFHRSFLRKPMEVLIEQKDRKTGMYEGLTSNYIRVFLTGDDMGDESIGRLIPVKFKAFQGENVIASPVLV